MDVLYAVGPDDGTDYFNLRMSLRSVAKFATHVGKIVIAGYRPKWLSDAAVYVPVKGEAKLPKQTNILNAIFAAINSGAVSGEFLYSSDDHFLVKRVDFDNYPYYYKQDKLPTFDDIVAKYGILKWKGYYRSLTDTRKALELNGYSAVTFCGHVNTHMNTSDANEVRRIASQFRSAKDGLEPTCLFMNVRQHRDPVVPTFREDCKIDEFVDETTLLEEIGSRDTFSIGEKLSKEIRFISLMKTMFGSKSRYET